MPRAFFILMLTLAFTAHAATQNILLIIADDYGADSCGLYNPNAVNRPKIPAMDALATNGVVFRNAYANPVCSPTRACLLTGRHGFRTGVGDVQQGNYSVLSAAEFTLPEAFAAGAPDYKVAQFGKWHLAGGANTPATVGAWPLYVGNLIGTLTNYYGWTKTSNGVSAGTTAYATTDLVNNATSWIAAQGTNRWLAWCAFNAPHTPFHKPPTNLCPDYAYLSGLQSDINTNARIYSEAMTQSLDTEMARLIASVNRTNTTIIFVGDNGTAGQAVTPPVLANRSKDTLYEGGVHVPLIIAGPDVAARGRTNDTPVNAVDLYATILDLAGVTARTVMPSNTVLDSVSLLPVLQDTNNTTLPRRAYAELFGTNITATDGGQMLRDDRYKIIRFGTGTEGFYDLQSDPYEVTNLLVGAITATQQQYHDRLLFGLYAYTTNIGPAVASHAFDNGQFSLSVTSSASCVLWRCADLAAAFWAPVTNAVATTNGAAITLKDIAPPATGAFYGVVK